MPLPDTLNGKTVVGRYLRPNGSAARGKVSFRLLVPIQLVNATDGGRRHLVVPETITVDLDNTGTFEVFLALSSDDDYTPGTLYQVTEAVDGLQRAPFNIALDETSPETLDLISVGPVTPPSAAIAYLTQAAADARYALLGSAGGGGYVIPTGGIPETDLAAAVTTKLNSVVDARVSATAAIQLSKTVDSTTAPGRLAMTTAERTKLGGVATGATVNATDAQLRDRSTHTGTQPISATAGLFTQLESKVTGTGITAMQALTQAAYDALTTKVSTTAYVIVG